VSDDLVAFLKARLDEDEQTAQAAEGHPVEALVSDEAFDHLTRWSSSRVLGEVAAKRRIIARCVKEWDEPTSGGAVAYVVLRELASVYDSHPDYRAEWSPDAEVNRG
jgi:hypothetical protein